MSNPERARYWRAVAAETLIAASEVTDAQARAILINIAVTYEDLALRAEASANTAPTPVPVVLIKKLDD
jgi:hypothetical protein